MNMPDVNKGFEGVKLDLTLCAKLRRASIDRKVAKSSIIEAALTFELLKVQLTDDDYEWIAAQIRKNKNNRKPGAK